MEEFISKIFDIILISINCISHHVEWLRQNFFTNGKSDSLICLIGKTAIVTGGNAGIGYAISMLLASRGCKVIIACRRDALKERDEIIKETNNPNISVERLDLTQLKSVRQFVEDIKQKETKIDILINNAGIGYSTGTITEDGLDVVMQTNYFGHFLLTHLLIDLLKAASHARIVFLSSGLGLYNNISVQRLYPTIPSTAISRARSYPNSKFCCIFAAQEMAKKLDKFGIKVNSTDPGAVKTHIYDTLEGKDWHTFLIRLVMKFGVLIASRDPITAAQSSFHVATSKNVGNGLLYFRCAPICKPIALKDKNFCEEIWRETEKIVELRPEEKL